MNRLKLLIIIFSMALSVPLIFFVLKTYRGLEQEEVATLRFFTEALFDEMEQALAILVQREEGRAIDEYNYYWSPTGHLPGDHKDSRSPLSFAPQEEFILGYFQNNPDGSFQTPMVESTKEVPKNRSQLVSQLEDANTVFNQKRIRTTDGIQPSPAKVIAKKEIPKTPGLADKYLDLSRTQKPRAYLGQKEKRVETITVGQALNISKQVQEESLPSSGAEQAGRSTSIRRSAAGKGSAAEPLAEQTRIDHEQPMEAAADRSSSFTVSGVKEAGGFRVEVAPLQSVFLDEDQIFIFRRIMINNQIYRQGFILQTKAFLDHLAVKYFAAQPMARYTNLRLQVLDQGRIAGVVQAGAAANGASFVFNRNFPAPFSFLEAMLSCDQIPQSAGRRTLNVMIIILVSVVLMGLFAIYQSAAALVDLSERRSQFVSSVTHELKTPLTNIRMYIEMLEQGIARNEEREQEYFQILDAEGARLSRLVNNVLELAKFEKKQRFVDLQTGTFEEVIREVQRVMQAKLDNEGYHLEIEFGKIRPFKYDREAMIQVLINLIENSMKFGKTATRKQISVRVDQDDRWVKIMVCDNGPGIPRYALKKVFDEFYRVDNSLTRTTRGTGIGLALVKKFIALMGGNVTAANNDGPGCTITISLPQ